MPRRSSLPQWSLPLRLLSCWLPRPESWPPPLLHALRRSGDRAWKALPLASGVVPAATAGSGEALPAPPQKRNRFSQPSWPLWALPAGRVWQGAGQRPWAYQRLPFRKSGIAIVRVLLVFSFPLSSFKLKFKMDWSEYEHPAAEGIGRLLRLRQPNV